MEIKITALILCIFFVFFLVRPACAAEDDPVIGLALSGGASWGLAHIGVLEVLEEEGIEFKIIAGTSSGALVGSLYAGGMSPQAMAEEAKSIAWTDFVDPIIQGMGFFSTRGIEEFVASHLPEDEFQALPIELAVVAADLDTGDEVVLNSGSVSKAVAASAAIPVIFDPVEYDDWLLADGGLVNNLPLELVRELGADKVIAVDVASNFRFTGRPETRTEVGIRAYNILMLDRTASKNADVFIRPDLNGIPGTDFSSHQEIIERGREAARKVLPEIRDLLEEE